MSTGQKRKRIDSGAEFDSSESDDYNDRGGGGNSDGGGKYDWTIGERENAFMRACEACGGLQVCSASKVHEVLMRDSKAIVGEARPPRARVLALHDVYDVARLWLQITPRQVTSHLQYKRKVKSGTGKRYVWTPEHEDVFTRACEACGGLVNTKMCTATAVLKVLLRDSKAIVGEVRAQHARVLDTYCPVYASLC